MNDISENAVRSGVCAPKGFVASGVASGLKKSGKADCALIYSKVPATAAAVFTKNRVQAASVRISKEQLSKGSEIQAVIVTSGNANAATGPQGLKDGWSLVDHAAKELSLDRKAVLLAQTGLIGVPLKVDLLLEGVQTAVSELSEAGGDKAAAAIQTTDTFLKTAEAEYSTASGTLVKVGGMAKGAGMIAPSLATMISVISTDAALAPEVLNRALEDAVSESFNMISVDGCCSTNDTVFLLANGQSGVSTINSVDCEEYQKFLAALTFVCRELAIQIVRDGEGANKLLTMKVSGAGSAEDARAAAKGVVNSLLVKCALAGEAPYWGRVLSELGASGAVFEEDKVELSFCGELMFKNGLEAKFDLEKVKSGLAEKEVLYEADLGAGDFEAIAYGCDMTYEYVKINMEKS